MKRDLDKWIEDNVNIHAIDSIKDIKELLILFSVRISLKLDECRKELIQIDEDEDWLCSDPSSWDKNKSIIEAKIELLNELLNES